ncbi:MAG: type VII secretion protein EccCa, partial [Actinomycetota bacterium]
MSARTPGVIPFHRPARIFPAPLPTAPLRIVTPPTIPESNQGSLLQVLFPLIGSATLVGFAVISGNRLYLAIAIGIAVLMVGIGIAIRVQMKRQVKKQRRENVQKYRDYLARLRAHLEGVTRTQSETALRLHPDIEGLWSLVNEGRYVWERRPRDPDFMHLRLGLGAVPLAAPLMLELSDDPLVEYEPDLLEGVKDLYEEFKELARAPVIVPAADLGVVAVIGDPELAHRWVASMLCEVVGLHAPDDVKVVGYFKPEETARWGWLKWLPHTRDSVEPVDETRHGVALATDPEDFEVLLSQLVRPRIDHLDRVRAENRPHEEVRFQQAVVLIEEPHATAISELGIYEEMLQRAAEIGVLVLTLVGDPERVPATVGARVELSEGGWLSYTEAGPEGRRASDVRADAAGVNVCEALARTLAPLRLQQRRGRARQVDSEGLFDLLHVSGPAEIAPQRWRRPTRALLRTPLGIAEDGSVTVLDLKESAEDGLGPHGLIVGATGSGKSELLRTLVTGLAIEHSPDDLAMVLVDFKGGATFAELARLPQTAGMITNIERDLTLVDRMHEALFGELERRQRILQEAGNFDRVRDYQKHRRAHPQQGLPPLPSLLVIIDEFGELLAGKPDFIDLFVSMGRLGRSLGVHLLLATQRLEAGRLRGLESHLRYRICLRTFSAEESQAVLGVRDAYELPPLPGLGYLSVDGNLVQFKAALSTRPYRERRELESRRAPGVVRAFTVSR